MKIYVGLTDGDWFAQLKDDRAEEVNFWQPGGKVRFQALQPNELFLFKQHQRDGGKICGGGFFVRSSILPCDLAWRTFGRANGTTDFASMRSRIDRYRRSTGGDLTRVEIGCIVLTQTFFLDESEYIDAPEDWRRSIVSGKTYDTAAEIGACLFARVQEALSRKNASQLLPQNPIDGPISHRLGVGAFRLNVTEAYHNACAITGEHTLPALEAAHIKPLASGGTNELNNGLLLRADLSALFSSGLLTVDADELRVRVSPQIRQRYNNGLNYYLMDGHKIVEPEREDLRPSRELLAWHNDIVFAA